MLYCKSCIVWKAGDLCLEFSSLPEFSRHSATQLLTKFENDMNLFTANLTGPSLCKMSCRILKWAADYLVNFNRVQVWSSMLGPWTDWHGLVVDISENTVQKCFNYYWIVIVVAPKFLHICPVNDQSVGDEGIIRKDSLITPTNDDNAQWWHMTIPGVVEYWFKIRETLFFPGVVTPAVLMRTNSPQSQLDCLTVSLHSIPLSILYTCH